jgi:hypothetical protein
MSLAKYKKIKIKWNWMGDIRIWSTPMIAVYWAKVEILWRKKKIKRFISHKHASCSSRKCCGKKVCSYVSALKCGTKYQQEYNWILLQCNKIQTLGNKEIKISVKKKLRTYWTRERFATFWCRGFSFPFLLSKQIMKRLQAWGGPEDSRKLRFPDFLSTAQDGGRVINLMHRPHLPPGNIPGTHFC